MRSLAVFVLVVTVFACDHGNPPPAAMPSNQPAPPPRSTAPSQPMVMHPAESTGVAACDQLMGLYESYFNCDKFKQAGSAAMAAARDGLDAMKQGWATLKDAPPAEKDAAQRGCTQGVDALRQSAVAMGWKL